MLANHPSKLSSPKLKTSTNYHKAQKPQDFKYCLLLTITFLELQTGVCFRNYQKARLFLQIHFTLQPFNTARVPVIQISGLDYDSPQVISAHFTFVLFCVDNAGTKSMSSAKKVELQVCIKLNTFINTGFTVQG